MSDTRYKFRIEERDNGYVFVLYPNNSNTQAIGRSEPIYESRDACYKGLKAFKQIVENNHCENMLAFDKLNDTKWSPRLEYEGKVIFVRDIPLALGEEGCRTWAGEVQENYKANIREG